MKEKRGIGFIFSGLVLGLGIGIMVSWVLAPVQFVNTSPASLRIDFKDEYRFMVASAYAANYDLLRAQARLKTLADQDAVKAIGGQAQRMLANGFSMEIVQPLADLSAALQKQPAVVTSPSNTPVLTIIPNTSTSTPTALASATPIPATITNTLTKTAAALASGSPTASSTPTLVETASITPKPLTPRPTRPTNTITPTAQPPFKLVKQSSFCEETQPGLLRINISYASGKPAAGVELVITWTNGEEHFFTGLKPDIGFGYADFVMQDQVEYTLSLSDGVTQIPGLQPSACKDSQNNVYPGGISLEFKQP